MKTNKYLIVWCDGKTETVYGSSIANAMAKAGYGAGAIKVLDYWRKLN